VLHALHANAQALTLHVCAGSLAIPLALRGASVFASDISSSMAAEASQRCVPTDARGPLRPWHPPPAPACACRFEAAAKEAGKTVKTLDLE
jgi:hypothetical protein